MPRAGRQEMHIFNQDFSGPSSLIPGHPPTPITVVRRLELLLFTVLQPHYATSFQSILLFRTKTKTWQPIILEAEIFIECCLIVGTGKELDLKSICVSQGSPKKIATVREENGGYLF